MQKAEAQHNQTHSHPAQRQGGGMAQTSPQSAQLEAMAEASPQAGKLAQLAAAANNSPQASAQRRTMDMIHTSPRMAAQRKAISAIHNSPNVAAQRQQIDSLTGETAQREETEEPLQPKVTQREAAPAKPNNTGLPDNLKSGIENLSGMSMDNVKAHYNSSQPAQLNALAYAQGTDIHVAPGQEQHLPHEAWHVVQQAQGRVKPTMQAKGMPINDDHGLEHEADVMGRNALSAGAALQRKAVKSSPTNSGCYQRKTEISLTTSSLTLDKLAPEVVGVVMDAKLDPDYPIVGSATDSKNTPMYSKLWKLNKIVRGHLLNHDLGGFGIPDNLYPITSGANSRHSIQVEAKVKDLLNAVDKNKKVNKGHRVHYRVEVKNQQNPNDSGFDCKWREIDEKDVEVDKTSDKKFIESKADKKDPWCGSGRGQKTAGWSHGKRRGSVGNEWQTALGSKDSDRVVTSSPESATSTASSTSSSTANSSSGSTSNQTSSLEQNAETEEVDAQAILLSVLVNRLECLRGLRKNEKRVEELAKIAREIELLEGKQKTSLKDEADEADEADLSENWSEDDILEFIRGRQQDTDTDMKD